MSPVTFPIGVFSMRQSFALPWILTEGDVFFP